MSLLGVVRFVYDFRGKIEEFLGKSETGKWIMFPFLFPFLMWCLYKLATDEELIARMVEAKKQKKISDYF